MVPFRSCLGSVLQKPPTCRCFGDPATSEPQGDGQRNVLSPEHSLAGGDDTSQCFQEILKIPALHKTRRAEDLREEKIGSFLSARAEQRRERSLVPAGCSHGGRNLWGHSHHPQHPNQAWEGRDCDHWVWSKQGRTQAWISHCGLSRTIANSPAEGVVSMSPMQRILRMITHLPHFLKSLRAVH